MKGRWARRGFCLRPCWWVPHGHTLAWGSYSDVLHLRPPDCAYSSWACSLGFLGCKPYLRRRAFVRQRVLRAKRVVGAFISASIPLMSKKHHSIPGSMGLSNVSFPSLFITISESFGMSERGDRMGARPHLSNHLSWLSDTLSPPLAEAYGALIDHESRITDCEMSEYTCVNVRCQHEILSACASAAVRLMRRLLHNFLLTLRMISGYSICLSSRALCPS